MIGLPKLEFTKDKPCDTYQKGKQSKSSFKFKNVVSISKHSFGAYKGRLWLLKGSGHYIF